VGDLLSCVCRRRPNEVVVGIVTLGSGGVIHNDSGRWFVRDDEVAVRASPWTSGARSRPEGGAVSGPWSGKSWASPRERGKAGGIRAHEGWSPPTADPPIV